MESDHPLAMALIEAVGIDVTRTMVSEVRYEFNPNDHLPKVTLVCDVDEDKLRAALRERFA